MSRSFVSLFSWLPIAACALIGSNPALSAQSQRDSQKDSFWAFLPEGKVVSRCAEDSAAQRDATAALQRLDQRIRGLADSAPSASAAAAVGELHALLKTDCFLAAAETNRIPKADTARSLKQWWLDGSGRHWLTSLLVTPQLGNVDRVSPHIAVPADPRKTLNLEAHRNHPLATLLCPSDDAVCGRETRGWRRRAEASFKAHRAAGRHDGSHSEEGWRQPTPAEVSAQCDKESADRDGPERYRRWRNCVEAGRVKQFAMPLGDVKAPDTGWLIVSGRRGHHEFCDTVRAYDLATGAAFIDDTCSALDFKPDGRLESDMSHRGKARRVKAGAVPVENLRESLWMLLLRGEAEEVQVDIEYYPVPDGVMPRAVVRLRDDEHADRGGAWTNTGQTQLTWRWIPSAGAVFAGNLTWPEASNAAESHAAALLDIAEEGFVERCAPRPVPPLAALWGLASRRVHHLNEVAREDLSDLDGELRGAVERWKPLRSCSAGSGPRSSR